MFYFCIGSYRDRQTSLSLCCVFLCFFSKKVGTYRGKFNIIYSLAYNNVSKYLENSILAVDELLTLNLYIY